MSPQKLLPHWITATVQKAGNSVAENEDAATAAKDGLRFAVSDGATEGWESGPWAAKLARTYIADPPTPTNYPQWLAKVQQRWAKARQPAATSWYAAEKQAQGSFATLLGLELRQSRTGAGWAWRSAAVGDSCLLLVREQRIEAAFPLSAAAEFGNHPALIPSSAANASSEPQWQAGRAVAGDLLLLATDAVAANLLRLSQAADWAPFLEVVRAAVTARDPAALLERLCAFQASTNDDMTLTAIRLPESTE
jgi:hypothetical protein